MRDPLVAGKVQHPSAYRRRRFLNWAPLGITYAFLYMGRYNLTVAKGALGDLMTLEQFGDIFGVGTAVYAFAFLINGPLTDRLGGRLAILLAAAGAGFANLLMGLFTQQYVVHGSSVNPTLVFALLYGLNMYFQSFGAVAIVKVNSNWFHVNERGTFSAIFGAIISAGIFLAFDVGGDIVSYAEGRGPGGIDAPWYVFMAPAIALGIFFVIDLFLIRNHPSEAGHDDIETGAARLSDDEDKPIPTLVLLRKILTNPIIMTVACIEFCTGVLRNGIMHWYPLYTDAVLVMDGSHFLKDHWGAILMVAGISGGTFAGLVSDKLFQSRRAPAAGGLYAGLAVATVVMIFVLGGSKPEVGWIKTPKPGQALVGLEAGDLIVAIDGEPVRDRSRFIARVEKPGTYKLTVLRRAVAGAATKDEKGREVRPVTAKEVELTLESTEEVVKDLALRRNLVFLKNPYERQKGRLYDAGRPALFFRGTWASERGLKSGDVILSVNGEAPEDWLSVLSLLELDGSDNQLKVRRDGADVAISAPYPPLAPGSSKDKAKYVSAGPVLQLTPWALGIVAFLMSICVIGTHGLLSGTATMDFGGKRGTATTVGVIDGFVYLGTAVQSFSLGRITSYDWSYWPMFLLPFAIIGFLLCTRIWHVKPKGRGGH